MAPETDIDWQDPKTRDENDTNGDQAELAKVEGEDTHIADEDDDDAELSKSRRDTEKELDHGLKETFPASDPVSINPGAD